jgi:hypothetical protein
VSDRCRLDRLLGLHDDLLVNFVLILVLTLLLEVTEDVVHDKVTVGLLGEEESLGEFTPRTLSV